MSEDKKEEPDPDIMLVKFNIDQVLKLLIFLCQEESKVPGFIMKMYMVWYHNILEKMVSAPTLLPPEDMEKFRKLFEDQMKVTKEYMDSLFLRMALRESLKQKAEKK